MNKRQIDKLFKEYYRLKVNYEALSSFRDNKDRTVYEKIHEKLLKRFIPIYTKIKEEILKNDDSLQGCEIESFNIEFDYSTDYGIYYDIKMTDNDYLLNCKRSRSDYSIVSFYDIRDRNRCAETDQSINRFNIVTLGRLK